MSSNFASSHPATDNKETQMINIPRIYTLHDLPELAAKYIVEHGWTQDTEQDEAGRVCLTGALRLCSAQLGDSYLARAALRREGHGEVWNDEKGRTEDEVIDYLAGLVITDRDLEATFGPQWSEIAALVRTAAMLTAEQIECLGTTMGAARNAARSATKYAAKSAARGAEWNAARDAAWGAARDAAWIASGGTAKNATRGSAWGTSRDSEMNAASDAAWSAARDATWDAAWDAARNSARNAAREAAWALVVRDLIGQHDFEQEQYDMLTRAWREVIGPIHPDDKEN